MCLSGMHMNSRGVTCRLSGSESTSESAALISRHGLSSIVPSVAVQFPALVYTSRDHGA
jgi:hypothetical protein